MAHWTMKAGSPRVITIDVQTSIVGATAVDFEAAPFGLDPVAPVITKSLGNGVAISDAANGQIEITFDPADTTGREGEWRYEVDVTDASGDVVPVYFGTGASRLFYGTFVIEPQYITT